MVGRQIISVLVVLSVVLAEWWLATSGRRLDRPVRLASLVTVAAAGAVLLSYLLLFSAESCSSRADVACMLNENQGILTALAMLLAAAAIWATIWLQVQETKRKVSDQVQEIRGVLQAATAEIVHNLEHIANACDDTGRLKGIPQISVDSVRLLVQPLQGLEYLRDHAAAMLRLWGSYREFPRVVPVMPEAMRLLWDRAVEGIVMQSVRVLVTAFVWYRKGVRPFAELPQLRDFAALSTQQLFGPGEFYFATFGFSSTIPAAEAADARLNGHPVFCWFDDDGPEGVVCFSVFRRFRDAALARGTH